MGRMFDSPSVPADTFESCQGVGDEVAEGRWELEGNASEAVAIDCTDGLILALS